MEIDVNGEGTTHIDVGYRSLPFTCKFCWEKGHLEKLCIRRQREAKHTQLQKELEKSRRILARTIDAEGFQLVVNQESPWKKEKLAQHLG